MGVYTIIKFTFLVIFYAVLEIKIVRLCKNIKLYKLMKENVIKVLVPETFRGVMKSNTFVTIKVMVNFLFFSDNTTILEEDITLPLFLMQN